MKHPRNREERLNWEITAIIGKRHINSEYWKIIQSIDSMDFFNILANIFCFGLFLLLLSSHSPEIDSGKKEEKKSRHKTLICAFPQSISIYISWEKHGGYFQLIVAVMSLYSFENNSCRTNILSVFCNANGCTAVKLLQFTRQHTMHKSKRATEQNQIEKKKISKHIFLSTTSDTTEPKPEENYAIITKASILIGRMCKTLQTWQKTQIEQE